MGEMRPAVAEWLARERFHPLITLSGHQMLDVIEAAEGVLMTHPCSDPDCCETAIENSEATERLDKAMKALVGMKG